MTKKKTADTQVEQYEPPALVMAIEEHYDAQIGAGMVVRDDIVKIIRAQAEDWRAEAYAISQLAAGSPITVAMLRHFANGLDVLAAKIQATRWGWVEDEDTGNLAFCILP